jgi:glutathione synthase/RimK-type ligase-like ATP-grasp enzyme
VHSAAGPTLSGAGQETAGEPCATRFLGLAPFLRASIAGADLLPVGQELLEQAGRAPADAELWMNLSTAMMCVGQREVGLAILDQALQTRRVYALPAHQQPPRLTLLVLMVPGDLAANTPIDCLLEYGDVDLVLYYVTPVIPFALPVPAHDAVLVAIGASDDNASTLEALERELADWRTPVINRPQAVPSSGRDVASRLLQDVHGLQIPPTLRATREQLLKVAAGEAQLGDEFAHSAFPVIIRPLDSQAGRDLERLDSAASLATYLERVGDPVLFIAQYIDYSGADGLFRKMRVALIDGVAFPCHMAVSSNWMVHYVNAGMYEDAGKRAQEAAFMDGFGQFALQHRDALAAIHARTGLDYVCIDCAETRDGRLLVFEVDHAMVVHAMDPEDQFPYKAAHIGRARDAFCNYLLERIAAHA